MFSVFSLLAGLILTTQAHEILENRSSQDDFQTLQGYQGWTYGYVLPGTSSTIPFDSPSGDCFQAYPGGVEVRVCQDREVLSSQGEVYRAWTLTEAGTHEIRAVGAAVNQSPFGNPSAECKLYLKPESAPLDASQVLWTSGPVSPGAPGLVYASFDLRFRMQQGEQLLFKCQALSTGSLELEWYSNVERMAPPTQTHLSSTEYSGVQGQDGWYYREYRPTLRPKALEDLNYNGTDWISAHATGSIVKKGRFFPTVEGAVVKVWRNLSGNPIEVVITGNPHRTFAKTNPSDDGTLVSVYRSPVAGKSTLVWGARRITSTAGVNHRIVTPLLAGEGITFFVQSGANAIDDNLSWDPKIEVYDRVLVDRSVDLGLRVSVGREEILVTKADRESKGLNHWPDNNLGVIKKGKNYDFFTARNGKYTKTTGKLHDPSKKVNASFDDCILEAAGATCVGGFDYIGGGPIIRYSSPTLGGADAYLLVYHTEQYCGGDPRKFYTSLGMARSLDGGSTFRDLGLILKPNVPYSSSDCSDLPIDMHGGTLSKLTIDGTEYLYMYYGDEVLVDDGMGELTAKRNQLGVARAALSDVINSAEAGSAPIFSKFYQGGFGEQGLGGKSTQILDISAPPDTRAPAVRFAGVGYSPLLSRLVLVLTQNTHNGVNLFLYTSADGTILSPQTPTEPALRLELEEGSAVYPTLISTGADPLVLSSEFYIYYVKTIGQRFFPGLTRWFDATLNRRLVSLE